MTRSSSERRSHLGSLDPTVSRRDVLKRATLIGLGAPTLTGLIVACGSDDQEDETAGISGPGSEATTEPTNTVGSEPTSGESPDGTPTSDAEDPTATQEEHSSSDGDGAKVTFAWGIDLETFDPHAVGSTISLVLFRNVFDNLVTRDEELEFQPQVAESWEVVDDFTWEFNLRDDVVFHDGTPLTSKDVMFSFENLLASRQSTRVHMIDRLEAPDDYTFRVITSTPAPTFLTVNHYCWMIPADTYTAMDPEEFSRSPVGSGPYKLVNFERGVHAQFERVEDHWAGSANITEAEFRPIPEASTRVAALLAGEIDIAESVPATDIPLIENDENAEIRTVLSLWNFSVSMNTLNEPFTDVRVRQALNYAVDVQSIIDNVLGGYAVRVASIAGPDEFGHNPNLEPYPYDPERAKSLLAEAGYPDGFETKLVTGSERRYSEPAQAVAGQLAEVGVNVEVELLDFAVLVEQLLAGDLEAMWFLDWGATAIHMDTVLGAYIDTARGRTGAYYNSPEVDEMIHAAAAEFDQEKALEIYHDIEAYLYEDCPRIFMYNTEAIYGVRKTLDWTPTANNTMDVYRMNWE